MPFLFKEVLDKKDKVLGEGGFGKVFKVFDAN
jgi:hypothetical protein